MELKHACESYFGILRIPRDVILTLVLISSIGNRMTSSTIYFGLLGKSDFESSELSKSRVPINHELYEKVVGFFIYSSLNKTTNFWVLIVLYG